MKSNNSYVFAFTLLLGDFLAVMGAFTAAYILRVTFSSGPYIEITAGEYARLFALLSPVWLGIFAFFGLYNRNVYEWRLKEFGRLFVGSAVGIMAMITYEFIINKPIFPARIVAVYAFAIGYLLLVLIRTILRGFRLLARHRGRGIVRTMVIGDNDYAYQLLDALENYRSSGYKVVATIMHRKHHSVEKNFADLEGALESLEELNIHTVILTKLYADPLENEKVMAAAHANHCGFRFIPGQEGSVLSGAVDVELFQGMPLVYVHQTPLHGGMLIVKRLFDIVLSLIAIVLTFPIMTVMYGALLLTGGKPVYTRKRLTRYGKYFEIYKFRSHNPLYSGLDPEEAFKKMGKPELIKTFRANGDQLKNDPRVTRIGRFMRATSIDEFPQFFNILKGDISFVGPRALIEEELSRFEKKDLILSIKSGLTGLAQISGRKDIPFEQRRQIDLFYVQNWSLWLDIKILFRTVTALLSRILKGAND